MTSGTSRQFCTKLVDREVLELHALRLAVDERLSTNLDRLLHSLLEQLAAVLVVNVLHLLRGPLCERTALTVLPLRCSDVTGPPSFVVSLDILLSSYQAKMFDIHTRRIEALVVQY